jgi:hypothetical protein
MTRSITTGLCFGLFTLALAGAAPAEKATAEQNFGFKRKINPAWFPEDPRQWSQYDRSVFVTDLTQVEERGVLVTGQREKGKWKVLPYEAGDLKGNALSVYSATEPAPVSIRLKARGWHAVYVGLSTVSGGITRAQQSGIMAKLGRDDAFHRIQNNMNLTPTRGDVLQDLFLTVADLDPAEVLQIKPLPNFAATVMYVRLVPLQEPERLAWVEDGRDIARRSTVTTWDGHSWIWPYRPTTAADLRSSFVDMDRTDFSQWWFCVTGADLVNYPSKVGTIAGATTKDFPTAAHAAYTHSLVQLLKNGVNPLLVARDAAREQGRGFHVFIRPQAWGASLPFEETFDSKFYLAHPEWRCVDREGRRTMHMSWAVPEVRQQVLAVFRETVEMSDPDGVGIFFNRGMPLMLWEKAFSDQFRQEHGVNIMTVEAEDPRIHQLRARIMTDFMTELRVMLDGIGARKGGKRYAISATSFTEERSTTRFGLDLATWVTKGLVDQLGVIVSNHTSDGKVQYPPPDMAYYRKVVAGSKVTVYPFVVAWSTKLWTNGNPADMCRLITEWYQKGADGIGIWDPEQVRTGYGDNVYQGQPMDVLAYLNHRELIAYWAKHGVPLPNTRLVTKLGENEYSPWYPNTGY